MLSQRVMRGLSLCGVAATLFAVQTRALPSVETKEMVGGGPRLQTQLLTGALPPASRPPAGTKSVVMTKKNGKKYYEYELEGPRQWATGPHSFASVTTSGEVVLLLTVAATDKQWGLAKDSLKEICESFTA